MQDKTRTLVTALKDEYTSRKPEHVEAEFGYGTNYEERKAAEARLNNELTKQTNGIMAAVEPGLEPYTDKDLTGWSGYRGSDLQTAVLAKDWTLATHIALVDEAREVFSSLRYCINGILSSLAQERAERAAEQEKDDYVTEHTAHEWLGPKVQCMVKTRDGWSRCGRRGDFVSVEKIRTGWTGQTPEYAIAARVECTVHATRFPKSDYQNEWPIKPGKDALLQFAHENAKWLEDLFEDAGVEPTPWTPPIAS